MTIAWAHRTVAHLKTKFTPIGLAVDGSPVVLVEDGHWHEQRLKRLYLHDMDIMASARQHGLQRREEVRHAVFERNGDIAIIKADDERSDESEDGSSDAPSPHSRPADSRSIDPRDSTQRRAGGR